MPQRATIGCYSVHADPYNNPFKRGQLDLPVHEGRAKVNTLSNESTSSYLLWVFGVTCQQQQFFTDNYY